MPEHLTVSMAREGGFGFFPGLAEPYTVDTAALPAEDADRVAKLVAESGFFELPEPAGSRASDGRSYTITVTQGEHSRTLTAPEPLPGPLRELVDMVEEHRRHD